MLQCGECGFVYEGVAPEAIGGALRSLAPRTREVLAGRAPAALRQRPQVTTWSALEYSCHLRDVLLVQRERVLLALVEDVPRFVPMYREERVELAGYASEEPDAVVEQIGMATRMLGSLFDRLSGEQLSRRCIYNFPAPAEVDIAWVGRHTVHEGEHHLKDIARVLERVS